MRYTRFLVGAALAVAACGDGGSPFGGDGGVTPGGNSMNVEWDLYAEGTTFHTMKAVSCDDPLATVTKLTFTAANMGGGMATTSAPCPKGANFGEARINLPDTKGDYALKVTGDGGKLVPFNHADFDIPYADGAYVAHLTVPFDDK